MIANVLLDINEIICENIFSCRILLKATALDTEAL